MKKLLLIALTGLLAVGATAPALALGPLDIEAELPYYTKYVWRGMNLVDDAVLQPSIEVGLFGFELGVWGNLDLTDINGDSGKFSEVDYFLGYELELPLVELGTGFIFYTFPEIDGAGTTEFYLSAEAGVLLSPSLAVYFDIDEVKGTYWEASVNHDFALGETATLNLAAGLGMGSESYINGYFGEMLLVPNPDLGASPADYHVRASLPFHPVPLFTIAPSVTYTSLLGDAETALDNDELLYYGKSENVVWGIAAGFEF
ncbi:MAG: TorF family putative porin [Candidatus Krumholzibacteriota bacterium]